VATDGAIFELIWQKYRGRPTAATRDAEMRLEAGGGGARWMSQATTSSQLLAVVEAVKSGQYRTQRDVGRALDLQEFQVTRLKASAIGQGLITRAEWSAGLAAAAPEDF
jgi:hypothetical protein